MDALDAFTTMLEFEGSVNKEEKPSPLTVPRPIEEERKDRRLAFYGKVWRKALPVDRYTKTGSPKSSRASRYQPGISLQD
jgi:hypothetical protein